MRQTPWSARAGFRLAGDRPLLHSLVDRQSSQATVVTGTLGNHAETSRPKPLPGSEGWLPPRFEVPRGGERAVDAAQDSLKPFRAAGAAFSVGSVRLPSASASGIKRPYNNAMAKTRIPPKVLAELNRQLNHELSAAYAYLALSAWCAAQNLKGFAGFFSKQSGEEREHAGKIVKHLLDRGLAPELAAMAAPEQAFHSLLEVAEQAQTMEQANSAGINQL